MTLHIYGQLYQHSDCFLLATRDGLEALIKQLERARDYGTATGDYFTADGEGYTLRIAVVEESELDTTRLPYMSNHSKDTRRGIKAEWDYFRAAND